MTTKQENRRLSDDSIIRLLEITEQLTNAGGWEWDIMTETMVWTQQTYRIHDLDPLLTEETGAELIKLSLSCYSPEGRSLIFSAFERCCRDGTSYNLEFPFRTVKGRERWIRTIGNPVWKANKIVKVTGNILDITEEKLREERILFSESKFRAIIEQAAEMLFLHDMNGNILEVNRAAVVQTGFSAEELHKMTVFDIDPDAVERADKSGIWEKLEAENKLTFRVRHQRKDGTIYPAEVKAGKISVQGAEYILALVSDISDRLAAENELSDRERRTRALYAAIPDLLFLMSAQGVFLEYKAEKDQLLMEPEKFIGHNIRELFPEWFSTLVCSNIEQTLSTGRIQVFEYELEVDSGHRYFECRMVPHSGSEVFAVVRNITAKREMEMQLRISESNARAIMESTDDVIILLDPQGVVIDTNEAHARRLHMTRAELLGKNIFDILPGDVAESRREAVNKAFKTGKRTHGEDYRGGFWNEFNIFPVAGENGKITKVAVFSRNITERKKLIALLEEQNKTLRESGQKYRTLFEGLTQGVFYQSADGKVTEANDAALRMLGISREQFLGKDSYDERWTVVDESNQLLPPEKHPSMEALITGLPVLNRTVGVFMPEKDEYNWLIISAMPQFREGADRPAEVFVSMQDITGRKQSEDQLQRSEKQLKELNMMKDKFFSIIAHDLKSPFNAILGFSHIILDHIAERRYDDVNKYAQIIRNASQRTMELLTNLLDWSRMQTGRIEYNAEYFEITSLIKDITQLMADVVAAKDVEIRMGEMRQSLVYADKNMAGGILRNLLSNALKFSHSGGWISVNTSMIGAEQIITVADNGTGIRKDHLEKLFRIDENTSTPGTRNEKGTGLGLILCKEWAEKCGGRIWVESEWGQGSRFMYTLPVADKNFENLNQQ